MTKKIIKNAILGLVAVNLVGTAPMLVSAVDSSVNETATNVIDNEYDQTLSYQKIKQYSEADTSKITWSAVDNCDSYEIAYESNGEKNVIGIFDSTTYDLDAELISKLVKNNYITFYVTPLKFTEEGTDYYDGYKINLILIPDSIKSDIHTLITKDNKVKLNWESVHKADFYRIYKIENEKETKIKDTNTSGAEIAAKSAHNYKFKIVPFVKTAFDGKIEYTPANKGKVVNVTTKPSKVKNIKIFKAAKNNAKLTWTSVANCDYYIVERKTAKGKFSRLAKVSSGKTSYIDVKTKPNVTYYYRVKAVKKGRGTADAYGLYSAAVKRNLVFKKPTLSLNVPTSMNAIRATWKKAAGAIGYEVAIKKNGKWTTKRTSKNNFRFGGLLSCSSYPIRVRAYTRVNGKIYYSKWSQRTHMTDRIVKCSNATAIYSKPSGSSKIMGYASYGKILRQKGSNKNGWIKVYIPGTTRIGYIRNSSTSRFRDLNLTVFNQNYSGAGWAPLGCEETSLASILHYQYGFNVNKNTLIDKYLTMTPFNNGTITVDPNYAFWGSTYHYETGGTGYGVYAPAIAQSAYQYLKKQNAADKYQVKLYTDYYTGNNVNKLKFDPNNLKLGNAKISGGLSLSGIKRELDKGNNIIIWYDCAGNGALQKSAYLTKGTKFTNPGVGSYLFKWYGHQHTAVITGYDDLTKTIKIANVWNSNGWSYTGSVTTFGYGDFLGRYTLLGRQAVVVEKK